MSYPRWLVARRLLAPAPCLHNPRIMRALRRVACAAAILVGLHHAEPARAGSGVIGVGTDVGVPDGAAATIAVRAVRPVRIAAGVAHNMISVGTRASITLLPRDGWFTPSLSLVVGKFPGGDANPLARRLAGADTMASPALQDVGYAYSSAQLGLEFGRHIATFFIAAGASRVTGGLAGLSAALTAADDGDADASVTFGSAPSATIWTISARIGLIVYIK
jgi:hypothetical protein